jgi:hypothetical protein
LKKRFGFVSNSSSSSFVLITTMANHKRALEALPENERKFIESLFEGDEAVISTEKKFGQDLVIFSKADVHGESSLDLGDYDIELPKVDVEVEGEIEEDSYKWDVIYSWQGEVKKNKEETIIREENF